MTSKQKARQVALDVLRKYLNAMAYWDESDMLDWQGCNRDEINEEIDKITGQIYRRYFLTKKK